MWETEGFGGNPSLNMDDVDAQVDDMILNMVRQWRHKSEAGDKPIAAVHGNLDAVARFKTGDLSVSGVNIVSSISGSQDVVTKANMLGNNDAIPIVDPYTLAAKAASAN